MPVVPRSIARERPPVCRSRWKLNDRLCKCWNVSQRDRADRALRDLREHRVAQLGERDRRDAQHAVADDHSERQGDR